MSLNALVRIPLSSSRAHEDGLVKHSLFSSRTSTLKSAQKRLIVQAKGKKGMAARQFQRPPPPPLPKIEDDGNPRFVVFIRMANVCFSSLTFVTSNFPHILDWILNFTTFGKHSLNFRRNYIKCFFLLFFSRLCKYS